VEPFRAFAGIAAPLLADDIDTDQIAPASVHSRRLDPDYGALFFARKRVRADGSEDPAFVLNRGAYRNASILVTGTRFGCGSARESAIWALMGFGIRAIVARSFAEMYRENCLRNGVLTIVLDESEQAAFEAHVVAVDGAAEFRVELGDPHIAAPDGRRYDFAIDPAERIVLLEGTDLVDLTLRQSPAIDAWEAGMLQSRPWLQDVGPSEGMGR
jgi:3-isopropylmalate/(R)-2-methylmalate dehydratase small subunit